MVNATTKPCIISTHEAQALAAGDSLTLAVLSDDLCPALRQADVAILQEQFKKVIESPIKVMAYLWRPESVEVIRADQSLATLETCQETATPIRCEAIKAYAEGHMSQKMIEEEVKATGVAKCDWRARLAWQNQEWLDYYNVKWLYVEDKSPDVNGQLLGTLIFMSDFVIYSGLVFGKGPSMQDMVCSQKIDCDVISTGVIDHLRQVGQAVSGQISVVDILGRDVGHATLQITNSDGETLFFDNGMWFLPTIDFQGTNRTLDPWQILSGHYAQLGEDLLNKNNYSAAARMLQKSLELDPQYAEAYALESAVLFYQGDDDGAVNVLQKGFALDSQNAAIHFYLGVSLQKKDDYNRAIAEYKKALELNPKLKAAHNNLAFIYDQRGDVDGTISELKAELANDPKNTDASESLVDLTRWKWVHQAKTKFLKLIE